MPSTAVERVKAQDLVSESFRQRIVGRISKSHAVSSQEAEKMFASAVDFLEMCVAYPGEHFSPTKPVDLAWHEFILYTREYADFCDRLAGRFIHHEVCDETHSAPHDDPKFTVDFMLWQRIRFDAEMWKPDGLSNLCYETNCNNS